MGVAKELCAKNVAMFLVVAVGVEDEMVKIKPVGQVAVAAMNGRTKNSNLAKDQIEILKHGSYTALSGKQVDISASVGAAVQGTVYYSNDLPLKNVTQILPKFEVTNETTAQAAVRLQSLGKTDLVALNFAAAKNVGGGFLSGAFAQEEDLCRCSGLYACLKNKPMFYNANILAKDATYTDGILYSPKVPFIRDEHLMFLENPFELSIITAPAPNLTAMKAPQSWQEDEELDSHIYHTLSYRATKVLQIAELHGHKNIILGAWGCGAFGNDAGQVASAFTDALSKVSVFEHVCFAVYDTRQPPVLYETFKDAFPEITS